MSDLSDFAIRTKAAVDALELKTDASTSGVHHVSVRDSGHNTIARLTAEVVARVRYLPRAEDDRTILALDWKVHAGNQMKHSTTRTLGANMHVAATIDTEAMCFVRALGALKDVLHKKMPELERVVLCSAIVGFFTSDARRVFEGVGFSVERREFGQDERHLTVPVYHATMELVLRTTAAASAPPSKKRSRGSSSSSSSEADGKDETAATTAKKKKKNKKHKSK